MNSLTESTPLLPSFQSTHQKETTIHHVFTLLKAIVMFLIWAFACLARPFSRSSPQPILPTSIANPPPALNLLSHGTLVAKSEKHTEAALPQGSLVVIARSELPSTTYPTSSLKKTPSLDSLPMKEIRSVRFSAIIDIHEFSRIVGEPVGTVQPTKALGVKIPRAESELRQSERIRLVLELEPAPLKSSYNHKTMDDDNDYCSSRSRYGSPTY